MPQEGQILVLDVQSVWHSTLLASNRVEIRILDLCPSSDILLSSQGNPESLEKL